MNTAVSSQLQRWVCAQAGAEYLATPTASTVSLVANTASVFPINGLRVEPVGEHSGWFMWRGGDLNPDTALFELRLAAQLTGPDGEVIPFLGLGVGWRFLITPDRVDVWFDVSLLHPYEL